jgi:xanthine dehydrogenase accessory factor
VHELDEGARRPLEAVADAVAEGTPAALATLVDGKQAGAKLAVVGEGRTVGGLGVGRTRSRGRARRPRLPRRGLCALRRYGAGSEVIGDELRVLIQAFATSPEMIIFGAIDFSAALAGIAREAGYRATICDARAPFVHSGRFAAAAEVAVDWPDRYVADRRLGPRDAVLVFTHDPKFDEPVLTAALTSGAGFVAPSVAAAPSRSAPGGYATPGSRNRRSPASTPPAASASVLGPRPRPRSRSSPRSSGPQRADRR